MGFGSAIKRGDRKSTYRAKYDYKGQTVSKTFHDRLSAQAWLNSEKSRVEADKAGVTKWTSPTDRKRQEQNLPKEVNANIENTYVTSLMRSFGNIP